LGIDHLLAEAEWQTLSYHAGFMPFNVLRVMSWFRKKFPGMATAWISSAVFPLETRWRDGSER
jgi:hypothetical protein